MIKKNIETGIKKKRNLEESLLFSDIDGIREKKTKSIQIENLAETKQHSK